jgi:penicillin-binding protein 2
MNNVVQRKQLLVLTILFFLLIIGKLFQLQIVSGKRYFRLAEANRIRKIYTPAPRGRIFAQNNVLIADSRPSFAISIIPLEANRQTIVNLSNFAQIDYEGIKEWFDNIAYLRTPIKVKRNIDMATVLKLEENSRSLPGVSIEVEPIRTYPNGPASAHIVGYLSNITPEEMKSDTYYRPWHYIGRNGIEAQYEKFLRGKEGIRYTEIDAAGREIGPITEKREVLPEAGNDIYLTIDTDIQNLAYELVGKYKRAAVVGLDVRDGSIICLVSHPGFNPEQISHGINQDQWQKLIKDKSSPFLNRATSCSYPPGSTIKPLIALVGLESELIDKSTRFSPCLGTFTYGNRTFKCSSKHYALSISDAIIQSCNVFFYQLGLRIGLNKLSSYLLQWGINDKTGIDLSNEKKGNVPTEKWLDERYGKNKWTKGILPNLAIGQGEILVTPLQLALIYSAIANEGEYYTPHLLKMIKKGEVIVQEYEPQKHKITISPENIKLVKEALVGVVEKGTGGAAQIYGIPIAGKTGTAENPPNLDHAWFVGYAPADNPEIVFCVIVENIGKGGSISAPIVRELMSKYFEIKTTQTNNE